jgi:hypothetical protein
MSFPSRSNEQSFSAIALSGLVALAMARGTLSALLPIAKRLIEQERNSWTTNGDSESKSEEREKNNANERTNSSSSYHQSSSKLLLPIPGVLRSAFCDALGTAKFSGFLPSKETFAGTLQTTYKLKNSTLPLVSVSFGSNIFSFDEQEQAIVQIGTGYDGSEPGRESTRHRLYLSSFVLDPSSTSSIQASNISNASASSANLSSSTRYSSKNVSLHILKGRQASLASLVIILQTSRGALVNRARIFSCKVTLRRGFDDDDENDGSNDYIVNVVDKEDTNKHSESSFSTVSSTIATGRTKCPSLNVKEHRTSDHGGLASLSILFTDPYQRHGQLKNHPFAMSSSSSSSSSSFLSISEQQESSTASSTLLLRRRTGLSSNPLSLSSSRNDTDDAEEEEGKSSEGTFISFSSGEDEYLYVLSHLDPSVSSDNWLGRAPSELYNSSSRKAVGGAGGSNAVGAYDAGLSAHAAAASSSPTSPIDAVLSCATPLPLGGENVISNRERPGNSPSLINPLQSSASIFSQTLSSAGGVIAQPSPLRAQSNVGYLSSRDPLRSSSSSSSTSSSNLSDATSGGVLPQNLGHNRPPGSTALQLKCYSLTTNSSNGKNPTSSRLMLENSTVVFIPPSPSDCLLCEIGGGKSTSEEEDL